MKICLHCRAEKPKKGFSAGEWAKPRPHCRSCVKSWNLAYQQANQGLIQAQKVNYYQANKDSISEKAKKRWLERKAVYQPARLKWAADHRDQMLGYYRKKGMDFRIWIATRKQGIPCMDCKGQYPPYIMEYDHVRGQKRHNIGKMANHKRERVLEEIAKCDLVCCICHRIRSHARRAAPKTPRLVAFRAWLDPRKAAPCMDCGVTFSPEAMDFDHVRGVKVSGIASMWSWSQEKVLAELDKCELVCANCHRERTVSPERAKAA